MFADSVFCVVICVVFGVSAEWRVVQVGGNGSERPMRKRGKQGEGAHLIFLFTCTRLLKCNKYNNATSAKGVSFPFLTPFAATLRSSLP